MSVKYTTPAQHKSNLRNVYGTFAIEGHDHQPKIHAATLTALAAVRPAISRS